MFRFLKSSRIASQLKLNRASRASKGRRLIRRIERLEGRRLLAADLVLDIENTSIATAPTEGIVVNDVAYFANVDAFGSELWRSNGTAAGTFRLTDLAPGNASSTPSNFFAFGSGFVFDAPDINNFNRRSLWYSDGTANGTVKLSELGSIPNGRAIVNGELFFPRYNYTTYGYELAKTNGTLAGTVVVKNNFLQSFGNEFLEAGNRLYFSANDASTGNELWTSDGTSAGTFLLKDITTQGAYGQNSSNPSDFIEFNGKLFFTADEDNAAAPVPSGSGRELWMSDGTTAGTVLVKDINPGFYTPPSGYTSFFDGQVSNLTVSGGTLFFIANDGVGGGPEVWATNGTTVGTIALTSGANPQLLTAFNGGVMFAATNVNGRELWQSNGTLAGTVELLDVRSGSSGSYPQNLYVHNGQVFFTASMPSGTELWKTNGTVSGTTFVASANVFNAYFSSAAGSLFFQSWNGAQYDLWKTDGTTTGTLKVEDTNHPIASYVNPQLGLSSRLIFRNGRELFSTTGIPNTAVSLTQNELLTGSSTPELLITSGNDVYFRNQNGLWKSDGTPSGTIRLDDPNSPIYPRVNAGAAVFGGLVFFSAYDAVGGYELWRTDGTAAGTVRFKDLNNSGSSSSYPTDFEVVGSALYFAATHPTLGRELWSSNGTESGTGVLRNIASGATGSYPEELTAAGGRLFFTATTPTTGRRLWTSDGTTGGTTAVLNVPNSANPNQLTEFNGNLVFESGPSRAIWTANAGPTSTATLLLDPMDGGSSGRSFEKFGNELYFAAEYDEIWKTNGTAAGTVLVSNLNSTPYIYAYPRQLTAVGSNLFFTAGNNTDQRALWKHDGLTTSLVKNLDVNSSFNEFVSLVNFNDRLVMAANDGVSGVELWTSDGTDAGTTLLNNIHIANPSGSITNLDPFKVASEILYFPADDGIVGTELFRFTVPIVEPSTNSVSFPEGSLATLAGTYKFADTITASLGTVTLNSGTGTFTWNATAPDGPSSQLVTLTATDHDGLVTEVSFTLNTTNVAPTIVLTGNATVNEGSAYTLTLGAVTDPGTETISSYFVDWGDGTSNTYTTLGAKTHIYADGNATRNIVVNIVDEDGTHLAAGTRSVTVNNVAPTIALTGNASVNEGSVYTLTLGAVTDPGTETISSYVVNWGDGTSNTYTTLGAKTHTYADGNAARTITVDIVDEDGTHLSAGTRLVTVNNVAPTIALTGSATVNEGSVYTLTLGAVTDPGTETISSYVVNWGDGTSNTYTTLGAKTHTYADGAAARTITVSIVDEDGTHAAAGTRSVTVNNVAPTIALTGNNSVNQHAVYSLTLGAITDPGTDTVTSWKVNWGDGTNNTYTSPGVVTHTYTINGGTPTISVDLIDEDGTHLAAGTKPITVVDISDYSVTNTNDAGPGSLRDAINFANANADATTILFNLPGAATYVIGVLTALPTITHPIVLDATTQAGYVSAPRVAIAGTLAPATADGLRLAASNSTIRGLAIYGFGGDGIETINGSNIVISKNYVGLNLAGNVAANLGHGVKMTNTVSSTVDGNVLSGNGQAGLFINNSTGPGLNTVINNRIGTNPTGLLKRENKSDGITLYSGSNQIGSPGQGNLISGNKRWGIFSRFADRGSNTIQSNQIGVDASGSTAMANLNGIHLQSPANMIGGSAPGEGNVLSGNSGVGLLIFQPGASNNQVKGNLIGVSAAGNALPNSVDGIRIGLSNNNTIGGLGPNDANVISGNTQRGITLITASNNSILGNRIGTNLNGTLARSNLRGGLRLTDGSANNTIQGNQISGNGLDAISADGATTVGNDVVFNLIGTDASGTAPLHNGSTALRLTTPQWTVEGNTISSAHTGIAAFSNAVDLVITNNYIGTNATETATTLGMNTGINLAAGSLGATITGNAIANNVTGVVVTNSTRHRIQGNRIYNNSGIGIDLGANGVTANDATDADVGANNLQNTPVISSAVIQGAQLSISFVVNSATTSSAYALQVEFFVADSNGQGRRSLGIVSYAAANALTSVTVPLALQGVIAGDRLVATATDLNGNTSEFSQSFIVTAI